MFNKHGVSDLTEILSLGGCLPYFYCIYEIMALPAAQTM
jgi:hypothetical protein